MLGTADGTKRFGAGHPGSVVISAASQTIMQEIVLAVSLTEVKEH